MNHNYQYGPPGRRHDSYYGRAMPMPHMSPNPGYQHYYAQPMGPMMPAYPQYPQHQWYAPPYQPQNPYQQPYHGPRQPYYHPQMPMPPPNQMPPQPQQHHGPLVVSSQQLPQTPPRTHLSQYTPGPTPGQLPHHPSSTPSVNSGQDQRSPSKPVIETNRSQDDATIAVERVSATPSSSAVQTHPAIDDPPVEPFVAPVPWLSVPDREFPPRAPRSTRRILRSAYIAPWYFPPESAPPVESDDHETTDVGVGATAAVDEKHVSLRQSSAEVSTPAPSDSQSELLSSSQPTTPSSAIASAVKSQTTPTQQKTSRVAMPVMPVIPAMPTSPVAARKPHRDSDTSNITTAERTSDDSAVGGSSDIPAEEAIADPVPPPAPKSWADLIKKQAAANASTSAALGSPVVNGLTSSKNDSLGDVLGEIDVAERPSKITFLQPRGLVNTGNMCYMNSILQILVFCTPFYDFLDKVAQKAPHTFKSTTPLVDAMIIFMREYPSIDSASSVDQLRLRLKPEDYEKYGDSLRPDFVYDTINKLPRFRDMRRGHQQDAQEFLGFLLEELHEECTTAMHKSTTTTSSGRSTPVGSVSNVSENVEAQDGWLEVGHKQKSAVTRASGAINADSPITNIFGGKLRSELKIPGNKLSVTLEPYQPLQLDIGSPQVSNIVDALKGLTRPESMQGDFQSARGTRATATKQVFIETLPPVLILHLKRFQYDSVTKRAEKIWKKVGYPLDLEIPKDVFQPNARNKYAAHGGLPKYRLIGVIYHHGKNANGGHYTVDIRRQDGKEWIRVDDTVIRRVRSEDVAEGGSEEDPKVLAAALEKQRKQAVASSNRYDNIEADEEEAEAGTAWSQVANGHSRSKSAMHSIVNGSATPRDSSGPQTPRYKDSVKDNKVAYLLFYQRI